MNKFDAFIERLLDKSVILTAFVLFIGCVAACVAVAFLVVAVLPDDIATDYPPVTAVCVNPEMPR